jgi:hypothetical protein
MHRRGASAMSSHREQSADGYSRPKSIKASGREKPVPGQKEIGYAKASATSEASDVQRVVRRQEEELHRLLQRRAEIVRRISSVKRTIAGLATIFGASILSEELLELVDPTSNRQPGFTKVLSSDPDGIRVGAERSRNL